MFNRLNRALQGALDPNKTGVPVGRQPTLETVLPGDVVSLWDGGDRLVEHVLECREDINGRETRWRWCLLDEGAVLETAPDGNVLYGRTALLTQDSPEFETLTCSGELGGVLQSFEARVREGTAARNPVLFEFEDRVFRIVSTGTFTARGLGDAQLRREVWRDVHPTNAGENVYFELQPTVEDEENEEPAVLGVWTTHVALLFGRALSDADVQTIYPANDEKGPTR